MKHKLNLIGGGFQHSVSTTGYENKYVEWIKHSNQSGVSMYVDHAIQNTPLKSTKNYAWILESKTIIPSVYGWCEQNINFLRQNYIRTFTHDVELASKSDIFTLVQCTGKSFIESGKIHKKTKLVSMVASSKILCSEHKLRQQVISKFKNNLDLYGRGFNEIEDKSSGLKDYAFSIAMENATYSNMFTEKITDCFMCGTIPIYYGISNIGDFFNVDGIILLQDDFKISDLSFDLYYSKIKAVDENFKIASEMMSAEDYIYSRYLKYEI